MTLTYTKFQLNQLISHAKELGYTDDVEHWTAELKKLEESSLS